MLLFYCYRINVVTEHVWIMFFSLFLRLNKAIAIFVWVSGSRNMTRNFQIKVSKARHLVLFRRLTRSGLVNTQVPVNSVAANIDLSLSVGVQIGAWCVHYWIPLKFVFLNTWKGQKVRNNFSRSCRSLWPEKSVHFNWILDSQVWKSGPYILLIFWKKLIEIYFWPCQKTTVYIYSER